MNSFKKRKLQSFKYSLDSTGSRNMSPPARSKTRRPNENPIKAESEFKEPRVKEAFVYKYHKKIDHINYMKNKVIKGEKLYDSMDLYKDNFLDQDELEEKSMFFKKPF